MIQFVSRETSVSFQQTAPARNQKEFHRLQKQITHLKSTLTMTTRRLGMWRTRALEAEAKAIDTDSLPEFLRAICRNTVLIGD
jgi:hypothetical protein